MPGTPITEDHARRLPKVELHAHVEGAARATTVGELASANGVDLPVDDPVELFSFTDLNQFLGIYEIVCRSLVTVDDFRRITYEALEDAAAAGVRYREMFFSPGFVLALGVSIETVWEGIVAGLADAHTDLDIRCRMILDVDKPSGAAHAEAMIDFAAGEDRDVLVGVGGDSVERGVDHRAFAPAFAEAAHQGLRRTFHAGEDGPPENIAIVVDDLGCERVDHGFCILDDPDLTRRVAEAGIPITSCPTSNVMIANVVPDVAAHPFARMRDAGLHVTLNSDDPGMMQFDLADEYAAVRSAYDYDLETMEAISLAGIDASWAPEDERRALRTRFLAEFDALRAEAGLPALAS